jgi:TonB dependent receptor
VLKPLSVLTLPTQNELNGKLVVPVKNATTGVVYPLQPGTNLTAIPSSAINPLSLQIISYFKQISGLPGGGLASTGLASNDYAIQVPFTDNADKGDLRFDWQINPSNSAFLRISDRKENGVNYPSIPIPLDGQTNGNIRILDQQIALGYTRLFGANKVLDVRLGLDRTKAGKYNLSIGNTAFNNIPGLPTSNAVVAGGLPSIGITGFTGFGRQSTNPQWQNPALIDPKVNFTWVKGKHSLKFGYEYEHIWMAVDDNNPLYGSFTYGGGYSNAGGSTVSDTYWADFLFGTTNAYSLANFYVAHLTQNIHNLYAQDDWHVLPNLTLNVGLRWEYGSPYSDLYNRVSNFDPVSQTVLTTTPGAVAGNASLPSPVAGPTEKPWSIPTTPTLVHAWASPMRSIPRWRFVAGSASATRTTPVLAPETSWASTRLRHSSPPSPR